MRQSDSPDPPPAGSSAPRHASPTVAVLPPALALNLEAFGKLIRERRQTANLTQAKLAKLAGLTEVTIRNLEYAHNPPSEDTLRRILEVPQLDLGVNDLPTLRLYNLENDLEFHRKLHWFIAPDYEILKLWVEFRKQLNSEGGHIDQTYLYLDAESAADYVQVSTKYDAMFRQNAPLTEVAKVAIKNIHHTNLDVVALGPGDGVLETAFVQTMILMQPELNMRLHLLDISQPLLNVSYKHATDSLSQHRNVFITGMLGNFYDLPTYQHIFYVPKTRPTSRIFVILGSTLSNIDNEIRFVRHSLAIAAPGDLLLLTVRRSFADNPNEDIIHQNDPAMLRAFPQLHAKWLGGPIRRYCENVTDISFRLEVRLDCVVPGSYALDAVAQTRFKDGRTRDISMCRFKRYNTEKLSECLNAEGWELLTDEPCKFHNEAYDSWLLYLFKRDAVHQRMP